MFHGDSNQAKAETPSVEYTNNESANTTASPSRRKWTIPEFQELRDLFCDFLNDHNRDIAIEGVKRLEHRFNVLKGISFKKIYDTLRGLRRYGNSTPMQLPTTESLSRAEKFESYLENMEV